jgi:hypothetical protein
VINFTRLFKIALERESDYFTFPELVGLPRWSQIGRPYGAEDALPAVANFEGQNAWEVMQANGFVYSLATGLLVPFTAIVSQVTLRQTLDCAISPNLIVQPGSLVIGTGIIVGYHGEIDLTMQRLYIYSLETLL